VTPDELKAAAVRLAEEAFERWLHESAGGEPHSAMFRRIVTERMSQLAQAAAPSLEVAARVERWADWEPADGAAYISHEAMDRTSAARAFVAGEEPPR
jgi:hypothetical protein